MQHLMEQVYKRVYNSGEEERFKSVVIKPDKHGKNDKNGKKNGAGGGGCCK